MRAVYFKNDSKAIITSNLKHCRFNKVLAQLSDCKAVHGRIECKVVHSQSECKALHIKSGCKEVHDRFECKAVYVKSEAKALVGHMLR